MNKPSTPKTRIQIEVDAIASCADSLAELPTDVAIFALEYLLGRYRSQLEAEKSKVVVVENTVSAPFPGLHLSESEGGWSITPEDGPVRKPQKVKRVREEKEWDERNPKKQLERRNLIVNYVRSFGQIDAKAASKVLKRDERAAQYVLIALARTGHLVRKGNHFVLA